MAEVARQTGFDALWFADHFTFGTPEEGQRGVWQRLVEERTRLCDEQQARIAELERGGNGR